MEVTQVQSAIYLGVICGSIATSVFIAVVRACVMASRDKEENNEESEQVEIQEEITENQDNCDLSSSEDNMEEEEQVSSDDCKVLETFTLTLKELRGIVDGSNQELAEKYNKILNPDYIDPLELDKIIKEEEEKEIKNDYSHSRLVYAKGNPRYITMKQFEKYNKNWGSKSGLHLSILQQQRILKDYAEIVGMKYYNAISFLRKNNSPYRLHITHKNGLEQPILEKYCPNIINVKVKCDTNGKEEKPFYCNILLPDPQNCIITELEGMGGGS